MTTDLSMLVVRLMVLLALAIVISIAPSFDVGAQVSPVNGNHALSPEFWLGSIDPVVQRDRKLLTPADYMELFGPPMKWPTLAARLSTFEISTQLVLRGTPEEQRTVLTGLRSRHIKLAGQFGVEEQSPNPACGGYMEGLGGPANAAGVAKRLHDIGGELNYLDMDEPVTWGHQAPRNKCPQPISQLAATAAKKVAAYRRYFPTMKVNLIDAVGSRFPTSVSDEILFIDLLGESGVHVEFFIADVQWDTNWQPFFEELAVKLHARGIKVGMYCNGKLASNSDRRWDRDSVQNCKDAGNDRRIAPDLFMIGSWSLYPSRVLPETQPGTLTHIGKELTDLF